MDETRRVDYRERLARPSRRDLVAEAAVGEVYGDRAGIPDYAALTRDALRELRGVVADLDAERDEIRRLRGETREILSALAA
jgi:hypothetical protein